MNKSAKSIIAVLIVLLMAVAVFAGCTQAERVSNNLSQEADSFNVLRKITVINIRTDTILYTVSGNFSINKAGDGDLEIIGENPDNTYYKHFVRLADEMTYVCEDMGTTGVNKYKYTINFNPNMIIPVEAGAVD